MPTENSSLKPLLRQTNQSGSVEPTKADYKRAFNADTKSISEYRYMVDYRRWFENQFLKQGR